MFFCRMSTRKNVYVFERGITVHVLFRVLKRKIVLTYMEILFIETLHIFSVFFLCRQLHLVFEPNLQIFQ